MNDDEAARIARAKRLRAEIAEKLNPASTPAGPATSGPPAPTDSAAQPGDAHGGTPPAKQRAGESPREFIHRRMRELDEGSERPAG